MTLGPVRVMGTGVTLRQCVQEVCKGPMWYCVVLALVLSVIKIII